MKARTLRRRALRWCLRDDPQHVHEFLGSTKLAGLTLHNHRFAGVSSRAIPIGRNHIHAISTNVDFTVQHIHRIRDLTGLAIPVGRGRHVHFVRGTTSFDANHDHNYVFATLIENPLGI
ncbi:MAG: YmaF family protein [Dethiobacteria bacterium]